MVIQGRSSCPFGEGALPAIPRNSFPFRRLCEALVRVGHRVRSRKVARLQLCDLKTCRCDDLVNLPIEVELGAAQAATLASGARPCSRKMRRPLSL